MNDTERAAAKETIHKALHDLNVRITGLDAGDCHCNLVAEVVLDALSSPGAPAGRWEVEDETYEVLIGDTVYDECDTLGGVMHAVDRCRAEIDADELEGEIRTRRIVRYLRNDKD